MNQRCSGCVGSIMPLSTPSRRAARPFHLNLHCWLPRPLFLIFPLMHRCVCQQPVKGNFLASIDHPVNYPQREMNLRPIYRPPRQKITERRKLPYIDARSNSELQDANDFPWHSIQLILDFSPRFLAGCIACAVLCLLRFSPGRRTLSNPIPLGKLVWRISSG